ncbi:hypothetical protein AAVH_43674 [Aphelenchoides avenae]|nr:hypothetical protein AAVH_43674 [Aphelenchus avenae]
MGKHFIGTSGTIAEHIHKLVSVYEYAQIKDDHTLYPLRKGVKLVELLEHYAPLLASPEFRRDIHHKINDIATGARGKEEVVNEVINEVYVHYRTMKAQLRAAPKTQFKDWGFQKQPPDDRSGEASSSGPAVKRFCKQTKRA